MVVLGFVTPPVVVFALATFPILFKALFGTEMAVPADRFLISRRSQPYIFSEVGN